MPSLAQNFFARSFGHAHLDSGSEQKVCFYIFLYLKISTFVHGMFKILTCSMTCQIDKSV